MLRKQILAVLLQPLAGGEEEPAAGRLAGADSQVLGHFVLGLLGSALSRLLLVLTCRQLQLEVGGLGQRIRPPL